MLFNLAKMKHLLLTFILFISLTNLVLAQKPRLNSIGLDYGGYAVVVPESSIENRKNPYMNSSSSIVGLFYERFLEKKPFSFKAGVYLNKQFESVISYHFPIEANGRLVGKKLDNPIFIGYTVGLSYNRMHEVIYDIPFSNDIYSSVTITKDSYVAPHLGINAGVNIKRFRLTSSFLYHPFVPKFVEFTTKYQKDGQESIEYHTNKSTGVSLRIGLGYKF